MNISTIKTDIKNEVKSLWARKIELLEDADGSLSSTRLILVSYALIILIIWAGLCIIKKTLLPFDQSILGVLGLLLSAKVGQKFAENQEPASQCQPPAQ